MNRRPTRSRQQRRPEAGTSRTRELNRPRLQTPISGFFPRLDLICQSEYGAASETTAADGFVSDFLLRQKVHTHIHSAAADLPLRLPPVGTGETQSVGRQETEAVACCCPFSPARVLGNAFRVGYSRLHEFPEGDNAIG